MRHSNTGKTDPQSAPVKRGFFATAGERLKRAMSGSRAETASAAALPATTTEAAEGAESEEVTTSVQAKARELLSQDRAHKRGRSNAVVESDDAQNLEARPRKTSPPPLPWQRTAADANADDGAAGASTAEPSTGTAALEATTGTQPIVARAARHAAKRPVRDSKSKALRERLGAAKAALAEAQAKRAAETDSQGPSSAQSDGDATEPEIILEFLDETPSELHAHESAEAAQPAEASQPPAAALQLLAASTEHTTNVDMQVAAASAPQTADTDLQPAAASAGEASGAGSPPTAASAVQTAILDSQPALGDADKPKDRPSKPPAAEPIRTLTIARVLARQGYYDRSLSIYDALLKEAPDDTELRAEADRVRADKAGD